MESLPENVWEDWANTGKDAFMKCVTGYLDESSTIFSNKNNSQLIRLIYDLLCNTIKGQIKKDETVSCLSDLVNHQADMASLLVDIVSIIDTETQGAEDKKDERARLHSVVRDMEKHLSDSLLKERLEFDFLGESGIVKNPKKYFNTVIKLKTKLYYKQQKFNLFREESEGYAKLMTELNQDLSTVTPPYITKVIQSLIGYFNLDPNRVLDIILESFECQPNEFELFISVLEDYLPSRETMKELLSFKFSQYANPTSDHETTPVSLYMITALLIQYDIVQLEDVYPLLTPSDEKIQELADNDLAEARECVRKMHIVVTNKQTEEGDGDEKEKSKDPSINNQKIGLLAALLKCGAWDLADQMMHQLPRNYCVSQPEVSLALAKLLQITVDPLYHSHSGLSTRIKAKVHQPLKNKTAPPQATNIEQLKDHVIPMLLTLGPHAHRDPILLCKIIRIFRTALGISTSKSYEVETKTIDFTQNTHYFQAMTVLSEVLLPSLSLLQANCCVAEEIWSMIRYFPYEHRYRLYHEWKGDTNSQHPVLLRSKAAVHKTIKRTMKQVSKDNVKLTGRQLGKLSHSSPAVIFNYMLNQIQSADNLIGPVVDSLKYLNNLAFDVMGFCIIENLHDPGRDRTKTDGTSVSMWLINLAIFCGSVFKKYNIELTGLLQYVANQLKSKHSLDLLIVKEIVTKMGGIEAAEEMTSEQLEALAGGELLRQEASSFTQVKNTRKSSQRLKDCLMEMKLAVPLVLLMAQQGDCVVYQETEKDHLKLVGKLFDQCHDTLVQFGTFLSNNLSQDDYAKVMPPLNQLLTEFHVNPDIAFFLARPMFNHNINTQFEDLRKADKNWKQKSAQEKQDVHAEAARMVMEPLTSAVLPIYPSKIWEDISPTFFSTFWSLTIYDLYVPEQLYAKKIKELKEAPSKLYDNKDLNSARRKKEAERLHTLMEKMQDEEKRHKEHVDRVMARLRKEKDSWFLRRSVKTAKNETITQFLQYCLFPRSIFTASDAVFAAKFVTTIHMLKTPNFSTLICLDRTFCDITYTVTCCTENEAGRYGRFLCVLLETVMRWHKDRDIFQVECSGYPGFITKFRQGTDKGSDKADTDTVGFENYRHVCFKWHYKIAKALVVCLESKDYVQIRNALIVLNEIISIFPLLTNLASVLEKRVEKVCEEEKDKRKDLYIKARSYHGRLSMHKGRMMREEVFHPMKDKKGEEASQKPAEKTPTKDSNTNDDKDEKEEGEIQSRSSEKKSSRSTEERDSRDERDSASRERKSESRDRKSESRDRKSESRDRKSSSRDRKSESRGGDMGPPASRKSLDQDSDRDFKRKRDPEREKEKEKSPVLDRLQKKEKLRKEKEKREKEEENGKKERKRDRDDSAEVEKKKRKEEENGGKSKKKSKEDDFSGSKQKRKLSDEEGKQNGDTVKRKSRR